MLVVKLNQSLVGLMVINVKFGSKNYGSTSHNYDREGAKTT
jgi:hypothetical protein